MSLTPVDSAVQQNRAGGRAPRPLPLFLELVRRASAQDPELAARALQGLRRYEEVERRVLRPERPTIARVGAACLLDCGGTGPPALLVPSLINPPDILDLDSQVSLADAIAAMGRRALLLDWGPAARRADLDVTAHVGDLLLPLIDALEAPPALVGYCLGGTMAVAAANLTQVEGVATIAAPWHFSEYPDDARAALARLWRSARPTAERLGLLPMEVLQGAFWSIDPDRTVAKFARFSQLAADSPAARRFVTLEDWANEGEPLPFPAARELIEDLFEKDLPGGSNWRIAGQRISGQLDCPVLHVTASGDRIAPAATAPDGRAIRLNAGHVGMVVGSRRAALHEALGQFLATPCR